MEAFREMVTGWLGKTLLVILVVPFAIFGIETYFSGGGKVTAARVNGEDILQRDVDRLAEQQRQQLASRNVDAADIDMARIRKDVLDGMINRDLLTQAANRDGYLISDATVYKLIREIPAFQENGAFSQARYEQALRQIGESPASYPAKAKQELAYSLLLSGLGQSGFVTNAELGRFSALDGQKRDIHVAMVPAARYLADIKVSDDDVRKYYAANPARFTAPETVTLDYITLKRDDLLAQANPTDEELQARYQDHVSALASNEQRQAQHILITVDAKTKDADALKKIQEVEKRARAGEDFGKLAREFSQDPGSVANGGDLGMVGRGQFAPEFDKALFSMKEGEISAPVRTQYGYHLIKLNKIQKPVVPSFAQLKPTLEKEVRESRADELFSDLSDKIDASAYESSDLKDPSEKFKLAIADTGPFPHTGGTGIAADRKVIEAAFSDDLLRDGKNSQGIHLSDGTIVWLHVKAHEPARLKPFDEVAAEARNLVTLERAREKAASVAAALVKALNAGESLADAAAREHLSWQDFPDATRRTQIPLPDAIKTAFRLTRPAPGRVSVDSIDAGQSFALVAVSKVTDGAAQAGPEVNQLRNVLSENRSQQEYRDYVRFLRDSGKVVVTMKTGAATPQ